MAVNTDPGIQMILENVQVVVASEGGNLEFIELRDGRLTVKYNKGVNEECPECVPDHELVTQMFNTSLKTYAPNVKDLELL
tara:strand:+ start:296 stop:538 length:243 start_codon:yes stop_codon:yes gene_type:complete